MGHARFEVHSTFQAQLDPHELMGQSTKCKFASTRLVDERNGAMVERLLRNHEAHGSIPGLNSRAQLSSISLVRCTGSHWGYSLKWGRLEL